jgi:hypothetical protein
MRDLSYEVEHEADGGYRITIYADGETLFEHKCYPEEAARLRRERDHHRETLRQLEAIAHRDFYGGLMDVLDEREPWLDDEREKR